MIQESKSNKEQKKPHIEEYIGKLQDLYQIEKTSQGGGAEEQLKGLIERNLTEIIVPEGVTGIGDYIFQYFNDIHSITSVTLPSSITDLGFYPFFNCTDLVSIICLSTKPPKMISDLGNNILLGTNKYIYVPAESVEVYKAAPGWINYADKIQAIPA